MFYEDGIRYTGYYHIHKEDQTCMTGAEHDNNSKELYFYQGDKLLPTKNPSSIPYAVQNKQKIYQDQAKGRSVTTSSDKRESPSGGGY